MNREKAEHIKTEVNLEGFLNSYKCSVMKGELLRRDGLGRVYFFNF